MIREKQTKSGKLLEVDFYPTFEDGRRIPTRAPKTKISTAAQQKYNYLQAQKKSTRIVNLNFDTDDYWFNPTYRSEDAPLDIDEATHDFQLYIRRVKIARERELKRINKLLEKLPDDIRLLEKKRVLEKPFKHYARMEEVIYKTGRNKGKPNYHFHVFVTGGLDRDVMENLWPSRSRINVDRFRPEVFGPEAAAKYMTKEIEGKVKTFRSRNLITEPIIKHRDGKLSRRAVELMAKLHSEDRDYWERKYKGYRFVRCYARFNDYNKHWYVSAIMYKTDGAEPPPFDAAEWVT